LKCDLCLSMVDGLPKDLRQLSDIEVMRSLMEQLVELAKKNQATIEKQTKSLDELRETIKRQTETLELKDDEIRLLKQALFGRKSERMAPIERELKKRRKEDAEKAAADKEKAKQKRKDNAAAKKKLPREDQEHKVSPEDCKCPFCGGVTYKFMGHEVSYEYEYIPAHFKLIAHHREQMACTCGQHIVIALPPVRVSEGVMYGPGMHAHVVVSKCLDSIPFYRLAKMFERNGMPICRSTLCDIFHRMAELLRPLSERLLEQIAAADYVNADETRIRVQEKGKTRQAYMWVFIAGQRIGYVYSKSRSGETPRRVLGNSQGILQVDQYSGYNSVTTPDKRSRAGCISHMRRKYFEAKDKAPELVQYVLEKVVDLYEVEYQAAAQNILGTEKHLALRQALSAPLMTEIKTRLEQERPMHLPKGPIGKAISYTIDNWEPLSLFLTDAKIRLDNNISEGQLRLIALGRKNYLFIGNDVAGENLAALQTLVATCVANDINPQEYLADVVLRIQSHPQSKIDELLPQNWKPPDKPPAG